jgi:hypothetical protein
LVFAVFRQFFVHSIEHTEPSETTVPCATANKEIQITARDAGVRLWQVAERIGMNDGNFSRKLRRELPDQSVRWRV